jgi:hypothetical protein
MLHRVPALRPTDECKPFALSFAAVQRARSMSPMEPRLSFHSAISNVAIPRAAISNRLDAGGQTLQHAFGVKHLQRASPSACFDDLIHEMVDDERIGLPRWHNHQTRKGGLLQVELCNHMTAMQTVL